jgi:hypothetical protein
MGGGRRDRTVAVEKRRLTMSIVETDLLEGGRGRGKDLLLGGEQHSEELLHEDERGDDLLAGGRERGEDLLTGGEQHGEELLR